MATVHLGRLVGAAGFARTVAIKRLRANYARDPKFVRMFIDEARLSSRIRHPNVAATIDVVSDGDELLLVLEYVHGESLSRLLSQDESRAPIDPRVAVAVAVGALHGLHAAHEARSERGEPLEIIHRDVSPQNILLGDDGVPRVVDFGIAKAAGRMQRTDSGHVKGKPKYMAPEQLQGDDTPIDRRVDVFSMGSVLWEMLTGRPLFDHPTFMGAIAQVLRKPIVPPHDLADGVGEALSAVVMRALSRDLGERYATALELAVALEEAAGRGVATQHTLSSWVQDRAAPVLAERQAIIQSMERVALTAGGRPSTIELGSPEEDDPLARMSDVLANLKTIKLAPRSAPARLDDAVDDSPTVESTPPTQMLPTEPALERALITPPEPRSYDASPMPRLEAPAIAAPLAHPARGEPAQSLPQPSARSPWLVVTLIFLVAAAALLVVLVLTELGR